MNKEDKEILSTNCRLTCGKRSTLPLDQFSQPDLEKEKEREKEKNTDFRERVSNFSLDLSTIGSSVSGEARSKVAPHSKGYAWAPVLGSFDKLQKVGVFSYSVYFWFKSLVNGFDGMRP